MIKSKMYLGDVLISDPNSSSYEYESLKYLVFEESGMMPDTWKVSASTDPSLYQKFIDNPNKKMDLILPYKHEGKYISEYGEFAHIGEYVKKLTFLFPKRNWQYIDQELEDDYNYLRWNLKPTFTSQAFYNFYYVEELFLPFNFDLSASVFQLQNLKFVSFNIENLHTGWNSLSSCLQASQLNEIEIRGYQGYGSNISIGCFDNIRNIVLGYYEWEDIGMPGDLIIVKGVFSECYQLENINIKIYDSAGLVMSDKWIGCTVHIEAGAFQNCYALKEIPFSNNCIIRHIGNGAFSGCNNLQNININMGFPEWFHISELFIDTHAFFNCADNKIWNIKSSNIVLESMSFEGKIFKSINFFPSDEYNPYINMLIKNSAFWGCRIPQFRIPEGASIESNAFAESIVDMVYIDSQDIIMNFNSEEDAGGILKNCKMLYLSSHIESEMYGQYIRDNFTDLNLTICEESQTPYRALSRNI